MGTNTNYTVVGLAVLLLTLSSIATFLWLSVGFDKKSYQIYQIYMNEPVYGLSVESLVKFNGVNVGTIQKISLDKQNPQQVVLLVKVEESTPITTSTTAVIQSQGLTGIRYIELQAGNNSGAEPLVAIGGEDHPMIPSRPSLMLQLNTILTEVTDNFQQVTDSISGVLDGENAQSIKNSLRNIDRFTAMLSNQSQQMASIIDNVDELSKHTAKASIAFPKLMDNISGTSRSITRMFNSVTKTMNNSNQAIEQIGEQSVPKFNALLSELELVTKTLGAVAKDLKRNPSMLIRGKAPRALGPGE